MVDRVRVIYSILFFFTTTFLMICLYAEATNLNHSMRLSDRITAYDSLRSNLVSHEQYTHVGGQMKLDADELLVNELFMHQKRQEYDRGLRAPREFKPAQHFFSVYQNISDTPLFHLLRSMPKGGVLHAHDFALCSTEFLIELSYRDHLWICLAEHESGANRFKRFRFSREQPQDDGSPCKWKLLQRLRNAEGAAEIDAELRARLSLYPREKFVDANEVWSSFKHIFGLVYGLLTYAPVWRDFYYRALHEFYADGVQYLEFRTVLPKLYDLDGNNYTPLDTARILREQSLRFVKERSDFIGSKMIYAPTRNVTDEKFEEYLEIALQLKQTYPDFFAGFDLVSQEDGARPLKEFAHRLIKVRDEIDFYFHAGETNWFGTATDENLIDAVLLGTKRIGHAFALLKHPDILFMVKHQDIAIEVSPISNQVLQLIADFRNHPCAHLFAGNYPVVIASDDPSFWKATPLTHDFYIAFMGIASRSADLGFLKQLACNSIKYSSLDATSKEEALRKFKQKWNAWTQQLLE